MSDLDATNSRGQSAAPITAVATGKLRAITNNRALFAQSDGLVDAFAEVFARMAQSTAPPVESPDVGNDVERDPIVSDEKPDRPDEQAENGSEPVQLAVDQEIDVQRAVTKVDTVVLTDDESPLEELELKDAANPSTLETQQPVAETVIVAAVEVDQGQVLAGEDTGPEASATVVVSSEATADQRRERRESKSVQPLESTESGDWRQERTSRQETVVQVSDEADSNADQSLEISAEDEGAESPRRLRRGRHDRQSSDKNPPAVAPSNQRRAQQSAIPISDPAAAGESAASQTAQNAVSTPSAASKHAESTLGNVQNVASGITQSTTSARGQAGTRGSTQAVESAAQSRPDAHLKPRAADKKSSTAETVSRVKLIQRVSKAFQHLGPDGGVVRLRLAPAEMGSVRVEMRINQRKVQARVVAETEAAGAALREHLPDLRARLESFGMQVERIEVETDANDHQHSSQFDADSHQQRQQHRKPNAGSQSSPAERVTNPSVSQDVPHAMAVGPAEAANSGVDVRL